MSEEKSSAQEEDALATAFPGRVLTHRLSIRSRDQLTLAMRALAQVEAIGGRLDGFHLSKIAGGMLHHSLNVIGLSAREARTIADQLAEIDGIEDVRIEHHFIQA